MKLVYGGWGKTAVKGREESWVQPESVVLTGERRLTCESRSHGAEGSGQGEGGIGAGAARPGASGRPEEGTPTRFPLYGAIRGINRENEYEN